MRASRLRGAAAAAFLVLALLLGGASARGAGAIGNALLQIVAVLLILFVLWTRDTEPYPARARALIWIVALFAVLGLLTLVPLPASLWTALPGRGATAHGFELLRIPAPALPLSLAPGQTIVSLLWLLPPAAMFLLALHCSYRRRRQLLWLLLIASAVSIGLGAAQLVGGVDSPLRFYQITNRSSPVGFFSNANHLATLLLCALPAAGYFAGRARANSRERAKRLSGMMMSVSLAAFLLVGIAVVGSLAGYGLALPAGFASLLIYRRAAYGAVGGRWLAGLGILFAVFLGLALLGPVSSQSLSEERSASPSSRATLAATTAKAVAANFPAGTGLGTFAEIYWTFQQPDPMVREYANHAHNDYLEIALEMGLPGALLVLCFILWWARASFAAWTSDAEGGGLGRAGSVMIGVVLLHSIVDYPLRTSAIASVFALACALLLPYSGARKQARASADESGGSARHIEVT